MANIDLSDYNLGELKGLQFDVEQALKQRRADALREARAQIAALAKTAGLTLKDFTRAPRKRAPREQTDDGAAAPGLKSARKQAAKPADTAAPKQSARHASK